jgi:glycine/D-amino acid oxidase-like deaminating enzyme
MQTVFTRWLFERCGEVLPCVQRYLLVLSARQARQELQRLQAQAAAYQTARMAYAKALRAALPTATTGDTIKFN